jgi:hypothetical protein
MQRSASWLLICFCFGICSCSSPSKQLFTKLSPDVTGINFVNNLQETLPNFNVALYPYFYNGGGVAIGDLNNDGLPDICFTGNMVKNRIYINKGNMKFEDVTAQAGINSKAGWCTGITMVDINADGKPDIYICRSGLPDSSKRRNLLYINNGLSPSPSGEGKGEVTFTEKAAEYGLDDPGFSTQASFFDYDKDGDLDMFLINESNPGFARGTESLEMRQQPAAIGLENKLFRNDNGHFINVSARAGIHSNVYSFSLGLSTADINMDGWPDIYVSNDYKEPDYLYINNKDGTFTDSLTSKLSHTSLYGMGVDVNDYNNDMQPDIAQVDMLPEDNHSQKRHLALDNFDEYNSFFSKGLPFQYMKNSLQKNNGDGTFSEIGQLAGISNTDWSWSPLFADFNNDGLKDLFISNGYKRDVTDLELVRFAKDQKENAMAGNKTATLEEYVQQMPSLHLSNYLFQNKGNDQFENKADEWGLGEKTFSNGAVYADLDNDGDLDLVVNNIQEIAGIYQNNADAILKNNYLKVVLKGDTKNPSGIGAKVFLYAANNKWYQEQNTVRGFQSSVDPVLHFGLGNKTMVDSLVIQWPDGKRQLIPNVKSNQTFVAAINNAVAVSMENTNAVPPVMVQVNDVIDFTHIENEFNDFTIQRLLMHYYSRSGPCFARADVNGDGREDLFIGGAKGQGSALFINTGKTFVRKVVDALEKDKGSEDVAACFFDADMDGDQDVYVGSGGYEFKPGDNLLLDRLYINDGKGNFTKAPNALPGIAGSTSCVKAADIDGDGDMDLFVGSRVIPQGFPFSPISTILLNNGKGIFTNATVSVCTALQKASMITDAVWADVNNDHQPDLITVGERCPVKIYLNNKGKLTDASSQYIHFPSKGFWNTIRAEDMDNDGDIDLVLGNQGWNNQFHASEQEPMELFYKDFDDNGSVDPFLCYYIQGKSYPAYSLDDVTQQIPFLNKKYLHYSIYADAQFSDFFTKDQMKGTDTLTVQNLSTVYLENDRNKTFTVKQLPIEAQYAPVNAIAITDINNDGKKDLVLAGNSLFNRIKFSRYDANHGMLFYGDGKGNFTYVPQYLSGLQVKGEARSLCLIDRTLFFGFNNSKVITYRIP